MFLHLLWAARYEPTHVEVTNKEGVQFILGLRCIEDSIEDRELLNQTYGAETPMKTYMNGIVRPPEEIDRRFARYVGWTNDHTVPWTHMLGFVISAPPSTGLTVGDFVGDFMIEPDDREGENFSELSYVLPPNAWGMGFGTNFVKALLDLVVPHLQEHEIPRIEATVRANNIGSIQVLERNGFTKQKTLTAARSAETDGPAPVDRLLYIHEIPQR